MRDEHRIVGSKGAEEESRRKKAISFRRIERTTLVLYVGHHADHIHDGSIEARIAHTQIEDLFYI
jgi:hypothetical protein